MAQPCKPPAPGIASVLGPQLCVCSATASNLAQAQSGAALAWQRSWGAVGQGLRDEWAVRFGGGVPIE